MKKNLLFAVLVCLAVSGIFGQSGLCDTAYWNHTYANARLKIYDSCVTITGVIKAEIPPTPDFSLSFTSTGDGDYHIYVQPDSQYEWMEYHRDPNFTKLCQGVDSGLYVFECATCLNVEEVCKGVVTDTGSVAATEAAACFHFTDSVYLPNVGEYVTLSGPFIYDTVHCWNEIHPVSTMLIGNATGIPEPEGSSFTDGMKLFPQPANQDVEFQFAHPPHAITLIKLYDPAGRQLYVYGMAETSLLYLDTSSWPSGEYTYSIISQEQSKMLKSGVLTVMH